MAFLTIFTTPKPFRDAHISTIQRNAIRSWLQLPDVEVLLIGDEFGMAEVAAEFGVRHFPRVRCNDSGTPLLSSIFAIARENTNSPVLCYVNADIIVVDDMAAIAQKISQQAKHFLVVGQRWDLDVTEPLDFSPGYQQRLRERVKSFGKLHPPAGSDYFIYPRGSFTDLPDFAIGRAGWDNWMLFKSRKEKWQTIDASRDIFIVHQNHDYSHLPGGQIHYRLPETEENIRLAGGRAVTRFALQDANRRLVNGKIAGSKWSFQKILRMIETLPVLQWKQPKLVEPFHYLVHPRKLLKRLQGGR